MTLVKCNFKPESIGMNMDFIAILPEKKPFVDNTSPPPCKVLYLLHGLSDDNTAWTSKTSIERYVQDKNLAVIMPSAHKSFYTDMAHGDKFYTYISQELPAAVKQMFNISHKRKDTFIAGLSMGGYGAFKIALKNPENYAAAASLSGVMNVGYFVNNFLPKSDAINIFGSTTSYDRECLFKISKELKQSGQDIPKLYMCCGTEDFLYEENIKFINYARKIGMPIEYYAAPGDHEWGFWDLHIQNVLKWLPI